MREFSTLKAKNSKSILLEEEKEKPMILNRLAVTKLLITFSIAGPLLFFAAFASLAQQPGAETKAAPAKPRRRSQRMPQSEKATSMT